MQIAIQSVSSRARTLEGSSFNLTAKFYDDSAFPWTLSAPTSARYRIDCLTTGVVVRDWTNLSAASSITISVTASDNKIQSDLNTRENKMLTVQANAGLSTQYNEVYRWKIYNLQGQT